MQEEIESVDMVIDGLLEMQSVGAHLPAGFLANDSPAGFAPLGRIRQPRIAHSDEKEG